MTDINTEYGVLVLGDSDTAGRMDMLADKAAEQGAVITQTYAFDPGEAANHEDLTCVGAVVEALSRAIETHSCVWLPFPLQDLYQGKAVEGNVFFCYIPIHTSFSFE